MKELTKLRAQASRAEEILVRAHDRGFGEQLATELLADLKKAIDIIDRLQQVKIPPLLFGEQLLATAFLLRDVVHKHAQQGHDQFKELAKIHDETEWLEEYR